MYVSLYFQSAFLDYDGDGLLDILVVEENANRLFRNVGGGHFKEVTADVGIGRSWSGRPVRFATGDLDGDGDVDFVTVGAVDSEGCLVQMWRNDVSPADGLTVKLVGKAIRNALNSKLWLHEAEPGGGNGALAGYREVLLSTSHRAPLEQYFALPAGKHYNLRVKFWPSGKVFDRADVSPGRLVITEP